MATPATGPVKPVLVYAIELDTYDTTASRARTLYFVSQHSAGLNTQSYDNPASQHFDRRLIEFEGGAYAFGPGKISGTNEQPEGLIRLNNLDGGIDYLREWAFNGRDVLVKRGYDGYPYSAFVPVYTGVVTAQPVFRRDQIEFRIRAQAFILSRPLQRRVFLGSGGIEGGSDAQGKPKPIAHGRVWNATGVLIDQAEYKYLLHDGRIYASVKGWDGAVADPGGFSTIAGLVDGAGGTVQLYTADFLGAAPQNEVLWSDDLTRNPPWVTASVIPASILSVDGSTLGTRLDSCGTNVEVSQTISGAAGYSNLASLYARRIAGTGDTQVQFDGATWVTFSTTAAWNRFYFRNSTATNFSIRFAVSGDAIAVCKCQLEIPDPVFPSYPIATTSVAVQDYRESAARVAAQILCQNVGKAPFLELNEATFSTLHAANSATIGFFSDGRERAIDALSRVLDSVGGFIYGQPATGQIAVGRLTAPSSTIVASVGESHIIAGQCEAVYTSPPAWRFRLGYQKNNTVQRSGFDSGVTADRQAFVAAEYRTVTAFTSAISDIWGDIEGADLEKNTLLDSTVSTFPFVVGSTTNAGASTINVKAASSIYGGQSMVVGDVFTIVGDPQIYTCNSSITVASALSLASIDITPGLTFLASVNATLTVNAPAAIECLRLHNLTKVRRQVIRAVTNLVPGTINIGDTVSITFGGVTYDRAGTPSARNVFVTGLSIHHYSGDAPQIGETLTIEGYG